MKDLERVVGEQITFINLDLNDSENQDHIRIKTKGRYNFPQNLQGENSHYNIEKRIQAHI